MVVDGGSRQFGVDRMGGHRRRTARPDVTFSGRLYDSRENIARAFSSRRAGHRASETSTRCYLGRPLSLTIASPPTQLYQVPLSVRLVAAEWAQSVDARPIQQQQQQPVCKDNALTLMWKITALWCDGRLYGSSLSGRYSAMIQSYKRQEAFRCEKKDDKCFMSDGQRKLRGFANCMQQTWLWRSNDRSKH